MASKRIIFVTALIAAIACADAAPSPFFDAIYDAVVGNGRRTYGYQQQYNGYNGYNGYGYNGYGGYDGGYRREVEPHRPQRHEKTFKEICRVHFPDSIANPGAGGITCPY
ncbi:hypothetical protein O0L34_g6906 [Tuta absoluta]|nr:hypothetical protein O0L34_g6906 [Tuta absoluta]